MSIKSTSRLTSRECFFGWLRFLVVLLGLMAVTNAAVQVYEHWAPNGQQQILYALQSFVGYLIPRFILGFVISALFLLFAVPMKIRPPWTESERQ